jgi:hypothetical protein
MRPVIAQALSMLETLDGLKISATDDSITVEETSDTGYPVTLWEDPHQTYVVNFAHYWHDHYSSEEKAIEWFMSGITGRYRLVCDYRWRYLVKCTVEDASDGEWIPIDTLGSCLGFLVWWLPKRKMIYQNNPVQEADGN